MFVCSSECVGRNGNWNLLSPASEYRVSEISSSLHAVFIIPKPALLVEVVKTIDEIFEIMEQDSQEKGQAFQDIQGDVYEMLLAEIAKDWLEQLRILRDAHGITPNASLTALQQQTAKRRSPTATS